MSRQRAVGLVFLGMVLALPVPAAWGAEDPRQAALKEIYTKIGEENYAQARTLCEAYLKQVPPAEGRLLEDAYGRILLGQGDVKSAKSHVARMKRGRKGGPPEIVPAYEAWLAALEGRPAQAITALDAIVGQKRGTVASAEAADILAIVYLKQNERDKAQKAVDLGLQTIQYASLKTRYEQALLLRRMQEPAAKVDPAKQLYESAEKLRGEKKFREAAIVYQQVRTQHAASVWADAAGFRMGECLLGLARGKQAIKHWRDFIKHSPAGAWRGQAHVAITDCLLLEELDLKGATEETLRASETLGRTLDAKAIPSWNDVNYALWARRGIVALLSRDYRTAEQALQKAAAQPAKPGSATRGLERLLAMAKADQSLVPDELGKPEQQASVAAGVGFAWVHLADYEQAKPYLLSILIGKLHKSSPAPRSYAALGMARILSASGSDKAIEGYSRSLAWYPAGSWHAETHREIGLIIERTAMTQAKSAVNAVLEARKKGEPRKMPTRREQAAELAKGRTAALEHWGKICVKFPKSPFVPQALYHTGVLYTEGEKPHQAFTALEKLCGDFAESPWTGDAHVRLIDVKLERLLDLSAAQQHSVAALKWLEGRTSDKPADQDDPMSVRSAGRIHYDILVRAGLIEYLYGRGAKGAEHFKRAREHSPPRDYEIVFGEAPSGVERLIKVAETGKSLTPQGVLNGDPQAKLLLLLADIYLEAEEYDASFDLCERVVSGAAPKATAEQRSYALYKRGRNAYNLPGEDRDVEAAYRDYLAAAREAPKSEWADNALFLAANIQWNERRSLPHALALWERVLREHPGGDVAARAAYYIAVSYQWSGQFTQSRSAYRKALENHGNSPFASLIRSGLTQVERQLAERSGKGKGQPESMPAAAEPAAKPVEAAKIVPATNTPQQPKQSAETKK